MMEHMWSIGVLLDSVIVTSSIHNQRIEPLWRDMQKCVTSLYYKLFCYMEKYDLLDNGICVCPMKTTHHKSPQLFTAGIPLL